MSVISGPSSERKTIFGGSSTVKVGDLVNGQLARGVNPYGGRLYIPAVPVHPHAGAATKTSTLRQEEKEVTYGSDNGV